MAASSAPPSRWPLDAGCAALSYQALADGVLVLHFAAVLFVVGGLLAVLVACWVFPPQRSKGQNVDVCLAWRSLRTHCARMTRR